VLGNRKGGGTGPCNYSTQKLGDSLKKKKWFGRKGDYTGERERKGSAIGNQKDLGGGSGGGETRERAMEASKGVGRKERAA